jgi:hypothetical protein
MADEMKHQPDRVDRFIMEEPNDVRSKQQVQVNSQNAFDPTRYENDFRFGATESKEPRTTLELVHHLQTNPNVDIEARVLCKEADGTFSTRDLNKGQFLECFRRHKDIPLREAIRNVFREDCFDGYNNWNNSSGSSPQGGGNLIGQDFIPLLGGPFYKQLYYHDYLAMHALAYYHYNHNAAAHAVIDIIVDFVLGRGFTVDFTDDDQNVERSAQAIYESFAIANEFPMMFRSIFKEYILYGEQMIWWLPNDEVNISYQISPGQEPARGILPRIRQIDPSVIWEIVTYPEDIKRVLYYQWVAPTQYQLYSGSDGGKPVTSSKFIFQQLPPEQVMHFKINCASNEKRGRSILFPNFGDFKRLSDTVDYKVTSLQKMAAWSIDTTIDGNVADLQAYMMDQQNQGTIPNAGSEFIHTSKIKREYLSNLASGTGGTDPTLEWVMTKIAMGSRLPISYLGAHIGGSTNRASALVGTEPVTKLFEGYQLHCEYMIRRIVGRLFEVMGVQMPALEVTFPELITQDRSAKIKDIAAAEGAMWISKERAATMASKELNITNYDYPTEAQSMADEGPLPANLDGILTAPGGAGGSSGASGTGGGNSPGSSVGNDGSGDSAGHPFGAQPPKEDESKSSRVTSPEKRKIAMRYGA